MNENDPRKIELLADLDRALSRLGSILLRNPDEDDSVLDATIQRFEFCIELTWKTLKKCLEDEGLEAKTPKQALQKAYSAGWLNDEVVWLDMVDDRNKTSHTYREALAREIYGRIHTYHSEMKWLYNFMRDRHSPTSC